MPNLVTDAITVLKIERVGLIDALFKLEDTIATPDISYFEDLAGHQPDLPALGLRVELLSELEIAQVEQLRWTYQDASTNGLFAVALAMATDATLVSEDAVLRTVARTESVSVHNAEWLIWRMIEQGVIRRPQALAAIESCGSRLSSPAN